MKKIEKLFQKPQLQPKEKIKTRRILINTNKIWPSNYQELYTLQATSMKSKHKALNYYNTSADAKMMLIRFSLIPKKKLLYLRPSLKWNTTLAWRRSKTITRTWSSFQSSTTCFVQSYEISQSTNRSAKRLRLTTLIVSTYFGPSRRCFLFHGLSHMTIYWFEEYIYLW